MNRPRVSRTAVRIGGSFVAVLGLFGVALGVTLAGLDKLAQAQAEVVALDHAKHAGHLAAAQVREQYIHQAHTIITWDASHLDHYEEEVQETRRRMEQLRVHVSSPRERALAGEIARLAERNDQDFRAMVLPAVEQGDRGRIRQFHDQLAGQVTRVVDLNEELNAILEGRSLEALARTDRLRTRTRKVIGACFLLDLLVAAGVGLYVLRSVLRPVSVLRTGAQRIAKGDLTGTIQLPGTDEFAELATTFNRMTEELASRQQDLVRAQKLASIGELAAGVAHEINNPLGVILGYTKVLLKDPTGPLAELAIIEEEARQCQKIVEGLLDLARSPRLELARVDIAELARDEVDRLRGAGRLVGCTVRAPDPDLPVRAWCDEAKLRQVVANLLRNAIEATPGGGIIAVQAHAEPGFAALSVTDSGPGIPLGLIDRVFDPFFTTKPSGSGLGLAVSQAIVGAHEGRIDVRSAPGETCFTVRLPASPAQPKEGAP